MLRTGSLLRTDPFSLGALGRPWIDVHWLFQLAAYGAHAALGLAGLVVVKSTLIALGAAVLFRAAAREGGPAGGALLAAGLGGALVAGRHFMPVRPVLVTLICLALFFSLLEHHRRRGGGSLVWLPVAQVVWVNCQGLSALGPAVVACYLAGAALSSRLAGSRFYPFEAEHAPGRTRALGATLALCVGASLLTPYGLKGALLPLELLRRIAPEHGNIFAAEIAENLPPFVLARYAPEQIWHFPWFLAAFGLSFLGAGRRLPMSRLLLAGALLTLALAANRNVLLLYWLGAPIAALNVRSAAARLLRALRGPWRRRLVALLLLLTAGEAAVAGLALAREPSLAAPTPFRFPTESAQWLSRAGAEGGVFTADHQGGYVIWTLGPRLKPYMDTRLVLRTAGEYAAYLDLLERPAGFDAFAAQHGIRWAILPTAHPDRYLSLLSHLASHPRWRVLASDGAETLLARDPDVPGLDLGAAVTTQAILAELHRRYGAHAALNAAARAHLAMLDLALGHPAEALRALEGLGDPTAQALRARAHFLTGDLDMAERLARDRLAVADDDVPSLTLLARISFERGRREDALLWLSRAADADPFDAEVRALLDRAAPPR